MNQDGRLTLRVVDVYGDPIQEPVDVMLRNLTLSDTRRLSRQPGRTGLGIRGLHRFPNGTYEMMVDALSYLPVGMFVKVPPSGDAERTVTLPVDLKKVIRVAFPDHASLPEGVQTLLANSELAMEDGGAVSGPELYRALNPISKAGLLNITAKSSRTLLPDGSPVTAHYRSLRSVLGDRFLAEVPESLATLVAAGVTEETFHRAPAALHDPPDGFRRADSFKTFDRYGNLQLTFFTNGGDWVVDADIDDAGGLEHAFQVVRNGLTGKPTHPYNIQQLLLQHQELDPGYRLILHERTANASASGARA